jgi:hypothetical protein
MRFNVFNDGDIGAQCAVSAAQLNPDSVLGLMILEQNASGDEFNTNVDDHEYSGTVKEISVQYGKWMQKYQLGALFTCDPANPLDITITLFSFRYDLPKFVSAIPNCQCLWVPRTEQNNNPPLAIWQGSTPEQAQEIFTDITSGRYTYFLANCFNAKAALEV